MKNVKPSARIASTLLAVALTVGTAACATTSPVGSASTTSSDASEALEAKQLALFDDLDFNVYTNQKWGELSRTHSKDIVVHWPDGHTTTGIEKHIEDLKGMFVWAPDTRIQEHPIKIAKKDWTAVIGVMEGTFTKPMPIGDGKTIPPTGKAFKFKMVTVGHWLPDGIMHEEYLFWDNQEFMKQIGLGK
jgi:hypothetical protein